MSEQTRHATPNLLISIHILWLLISSLLHSLLLSLFPLPLLQTLLLSSSNPLLTPGISPTYVRPPSLSLSLCLFSPFFFLLLLFFFFFSSRFSPRFPPRRWNSNFQRVRVRAACVCVRVRKRERANRGKREDFSFLCARDSRVARSTDYLRPSLWGVTYYYLPLT